MNTIYRAKVLIPNKSVGLRLEVEYRFPSMEERNMFLSMCYDDGIEVLGFGSDIMQNAKEAFATVKKTQEMEF